MLGHFTTGGFDEWWKLVVVGAMALLLIKGILTPGKGDKKGGEGKGGSSSSSSNSNSSNNTSNPS